MIDLDQSGNPSLRLRVGLGPTLGDVIMPDRPSQTISSGGTTTLGSGASIVLVSVMALVTIQLPDVRSWVQEFAYQPATAFERSIWIKDFGGNAAAFPISVTPFGTQAIDLLPSFTLISNHAMIRLYPLFNLTGWFVG